MEFFSGIGLLLYILGMLVGLVLVPLGFPGTWLIVLMSVLFSLVTDYHPQKSDWGVVGFVILLALIAELMEFGITLVSSKKMRVSNGAIVASMIGGFIGAIIGVPIIIIGSLVGLFVGVFLGAFLYEFYQHRNWRQAVSTSIAAFFSRITSMFVKTMVALVMVVYLLMKTF